MKTVTLLQLRTRSRQRADMENSTFVSDSELDDYINDSIDELGDLIVSAVEDYNVVEFPFTIAGGSDRVTFPTDFYKLRGVDDLRDPANPITVNPFNFAERNDIHRDGFPRALLHSSDVEYDIVGNELLFIPAGRAPGSYKIWYNPVQTLLVADGDTFDGQSGWHEYVVIDAAIKMKEKEESSTTALERAKEKMRKRVLKMAPSRDTGRVQTVRRIRNKRRHRRLSTLPG